MVFQGRRRATARIAFAVLWALAPLFSSAAWGVEMESSARIDPRLAKRPTVETFRPEFKDVWAAALDRPHVDYQRRALLAITLAHRAGMSDLDSLQPRLSELLVADDTHPVVRQAAAIALIELEQQATAPALAAAAEKRGLNLARIVEPALARWRYEPIRTVWIERLTDADVSQELRSLAITGLTKAKAGAAVEPLRKLLLDSNAAANQRLQAAQALGAIRDAGLLDDVARLNESPQSIDRLCGVSLLVRHEGPATIKRLLRFVKDDEPAVATVALRRLLELDPKSVAPLWYQLLNNRDATIRRLLVDVMLRDAKPDSVKRLAALLADPHPGVRDAAAHALVDLGHQEVFSDLVRQTATQLLASDDPRPLELAIFVLGSLDHKPVAGRLVELLESKFPPVAIAAAWALAQLAVPETGAAIQRRVKQQIAESDAIAVELKKMNANYEPPDFTDMYAQHEHLLVALALMQHDPAAKVLAKYVPKPPLLADTDPPYVETYCMEPLRAAAVWGLGKYYGADASDDMIKSIYERAMDDNIAHPESTQVRTAAAISLGRFGRQSDKLLTELRTLSSAEYVADEVAAASAWSLAQLTGDQVPGTLPPRETVRLNWFLRPLGE